MLSHKADALVITCMDYRIHDPLGQQFIQYLRNMGLEAWDLRTEQGGVKDLLPDAPAACQRSLIEAIRISTQLHDVDTVLLFNHAGCGAYRPFATAELEQEQHTVDLRQARRIILKTFPTLTVRLFFVGMGETDERGVLLRFREVGVTAASQPVH